MCVPAAVSHRLPGRVAEEGPTSRYLSKEETLATATQREAAYEEDERGFGWLLFAATMLGLAGVLSIIDGIVAISRSKFYTPNSSSVFTDLRSWGWITLIIGVLLIV